MEDPFIYSRLQFAFTVAFHYIFPQLTMGLALMIVIMKTLALRRNDEKYNRAAKFWSKIFAINFVMGVVTGIPMEFQFGTNWAKFSELTGNVIGQTLAMEGMFSFFLESTFLGLFLFGEKKLGPKLHWVAGFCVFLGSWLSGYLIVLTNAWMQHPVGFEFLENGKFALTSYWALLLNPWGLWQYFHTMIGAVITASFVLAGIGAFYLLRNMHEEYGKLFLRMGIIAGVIATILAAFPTGDHQAKNMAKHQPVSFAAMEGLFKTERGAPITLIGQPNMKTLHLDNPIHIPRFLSFLTYASFSAEVKGLTEYPEEKWPTNIPLLYYSYHIMAGLGTIFILVMLLSIIFLYRKKLFNTKWLLWVLMLMVPFPYIANTAGWFNAELGRQPWLVYNLMRTSEGVSPHISDGNNLFTLIGFIGLYFLLGVLFLLLVGREINHGPEFRK
jgi:cytochrome d ubiquinol oxidase subunit I